MQLATLNKIPESTSLVNGFLGVNKNLQINETEFADMENMTNDNYPVLTVRKKRAVVNTLTKPMAAAGGRYLSYVDDNKLYYDQTLVKELEDTDKERQLLMMGAYLCVFPDGVIYNTYTQELDTIENETSSDGVTISLCKLDGTKYDSDNTVVSDTEPEDKTKYWLDTSTDTAVLKLYSQTESQWVSVATTYVKFEGTGIGKGFSVYDAVTFSGVDSGDWLYNDYDFNQSNIIYACGDDYLIVIGLINLTHTNSKTITFKREMPAMDYVCEQDNRIWGCSSDNHEIYACKQGDPKNWNCFMGLDSDSYAATVGSEDVFTGCISYGGYMFFFKEAGYHKLYGTKPSNYEMVWKAGRGVQIGSEKSLGIVNDYMIFKAKDGVYMYDGSFECISTNLGVVNYYDAVAGIYRNKYYISMRDADYETKLYVYDVSKNTWIIEDNLKVKYFATTNSSMYMITDDNQLLATSAEDMYVKSFPGDTMAPGDTFYPGDTIEADLENTIEWSFETGDLGMNSPYNKYLKRIILRLWLDTSAKLKIEISYDSSDDWQQVMEYYCTRKRNYEMPIQIQRCDHLKLRFSGWGEFRLFSIAKVAEEGTAVNG